MLVPEAAVYEHYSLVLAQDDIWRPRQLPTMKAKPKSYAVKEFPNSDLGFGIHLPYRAHGVLVNRSFRIQRCLGILHAARAFQ